MTAPTMRRVEALEAEAFRAQQLHARVVDRLDHLTSAIGDLSQDGREMALSIRELDAKVDRLAEQVSAGFAAVLARLDALSGQTTE